MIMFNFLELLSPTHYLYITMNSKKNEANFKEN